MVYVLTDSKDKKFKVVTSMENINAFLGLPIDQSFEETLWDINHNEQFNNAKYEYKINKDFILVHFMLREHNKEMTFTYQDLYRIIETNDFLFVFISNRESFTVEKKGFENPSDVDAVRKFFIDKGVKYKDFRKKVK